MVAIRNTSDQRIEVSEASFATGASGQGGRLGGRVLTAAEVEDEIRLNASSGRAVNAFGLFFASMGAQSRAEQHHYAHDAADDADAINTSEVIQLNGVGDILQRTTIEPGSMASGLVIIEPPRYEACRVINYPAPPCRVGLVIELDGERHWFEFDELQVR